MEIKPTFKILSLNGGGIKGIYTLYLLYALEDHFCKNDETLGDYFDLFCATSTGAIIALCMSLKMKIKDIIKLYEKYATSIFPDHNHHWLTQSFYDFYRDVLQASGCEYDVTKLSELCNDMLENKTTNDLQHLICIPSYCLQTKQNLIFKSCLKKQIPYKLTDICLASTAAPTYFPVHKINADNDGVNADHYCVDGGVWANNPVMIGITEALENYVGEDKKYGSYDILSVGNVGNIHIQHNINVNHFWNITNIPTLFNVILSSNEQAVLKYAKTITKCTNGNITYVDGSKDLIDPPSVPIDDTNKKIMEKLSIFGFSKGQSLINDKTNKIERFFHGQRTYFLTPNSL